MNMERLVFFARAASSHSLMITLFFFCFSFMFFIFLLLIWTCVFREKHNSLTTTTKKNWSLTYWIIIIHTYYLLLWIRNKQTKKNATPSTKKKQHERIKRITKKYDKKIQNLKNTDEKQTLNLLSMWLCVFHGKYTKNKMKKQKKTPWSFFSFDSIYYIQTALAAIRFFSADQRNFMGNFSRSSVLWVSIPRKWSTFRAFSKCKQHRYANNNNKKKIALMNRGMFSSSQKYNK